MKDPRQAENRNHVWVADIQEEDQVRGLYLVKAKNVSLTRKGEAYLSLTLADKTGEIQARLWENAREGAEGFKEGDIIHVEGTAGSYRDQVQITLSRIAPHEEEADPALFLETSKRDPADMVMDLREVLKSIRQHHLRTLVDRFLTDNGFMSQLRRAPAAKSFHHSYLGGLLEHTLSVCRMCQTVADHYSELDRELLLAGGFLHDIGKIREMKVRYQIEYTDEGRLLGHIVLGVRMLEERLRNLRAFPFETRLRLTHMILSHHGEFEFGSPKRPKFLEAYALHLVDDLDAKMNGLRRFMEQDHREGSWTEYNRLFQRFFLKGNVCEVEDENGARGPGRDERQRVLFEE